MVALFLSVVIVVDWCCCYSFLLLLLLLLLVLLLLLLWSVCNLFEWFDATAVKVFFISVADDVREAPDEVRNLHHADRRGRVGVVAPEPKSWFVYLSKSLKPPKSELTVRLFTQRFDQPFGACKTIPSTSTIWRCYRHLQ